MRPIRIRTLVVELFEVYRRARAAGFGRRESARTALEIVRVIATVRPRR